MVRLLKTIIQWISSKILKSSYSKTLLESSSYTKRNASRENKENQNVLEVNNLKVYFKEKKPFLSKEQPYKKAVDDVSISIEPGVTHAIVGESGSGKTTVAKAIMGLTNITEGNIKILNQDILKMKNNYRSNFRRNYQMIFQDPFSSLNPRMRVGSIIKEGLSFLKPDLNNEEVNSSIINAIKSVGLNENSIYKYLINSRVGSVNCNS